MFVARTVRSYGGACCTLLLMQSVRKCNGAQLAEVAIGSQAPHWGSRQQVFRWICLARDKRVTSAFGDMCFFVFACQGLFCGVLVPQEGAKYQPGP
jgi:hypothetical protein